MSAIWRRHLEAGTFEVVAEQGTKVRGAPARAESGGESLVKGAAVVTKAAATPRWHVLPQNSCSADRQGRRDTEKAPA